MRLKLVPDNTNVNFFQSTRLTFGASVLAMILSIFLFFFNGLNLGIDFLGGTTIRTDSQTSVDIAAYRAALKPLNLGDVTVTEIFDVTKPDLNAAQIRFEAQSGEEAATVEVIRSVKAALMSLDETITFPQVESVGPEVSGELVQAAITAVLAAIGAVLFYIWLRFEWQFSVGAIAALLHDIVITIGIFSLLQIKFDLAIIAALLTIVGYSLNDTVVVFDRVRENLRKYKKTPLKDLLNMSINATLSRTVMTSLTTLIALISLFILGGDVIHGFVFAMIWGVIIGTYSSVFVASSILLRLGVKRDWDKTNDGKAGTQFAGIDA
ncbi:protein translocase subunit SecF [Amylibacter sp.]|nr:protein translocase subunit SecF [Amylibacter sp.]MDB2600311.1 protein translocase subunit SecF [Amylibacter sp.]